MRAHYPQAAVVESHVFAYRHDGVHPVLSKSPLRVPGHVAVPCPYPVPCHLAYPRPLTSPSTVCVHNPGYVVGSPACLSEVFREEISDGRPSSRESPLAAVCARLYLEPHPTDALTLRGR